MNKIVIALIVVAVLAFVWYRRQPGAAPSQNTRGMLTIFGSMGCGWTKKQLEHCDNKNIPYKFVDCDKGGCPAFVTGYPTMKTDDGKVIEGFKEL